MDPTKDFKSLQEQVQASLIAATRSAGLISSEDLGFHRSFNPEVGTALDEQSGRLLALSSQLIKSATSISDLRAPPLEDTDDVENSWRSVVDVIDSLLEKTDTCLDEYTGMIKRKEQPGVEQATSKEKRQPLGSAFRTQNLLKPQLAFDVPPNNEDESPWKPFLTFKPHAIVPLEETLGTMTNDFDQEQYDYTTFLPLLALPPPASTPEGLSKPQRQKYNKRLRKLKNMGSTLRNSTSGNTDNRFRFKHPYETEILTLQYPERIYQKSEPIPYQPVESTSATFVDTEEGVLEMLNELKTVNEIAIDLEHHDARSYVGLVSLMQISTREKDWIVDTLKPWRHKLQILNEVFADPKIIKVFHGAFMDIVWLQRDLGLYVVGLFDTHWASRTLGYQGGSLAFLLKKFVDFDADKKYQLADWRIRPIPEEMFFYARADTHFLLYIYDNMRNELIDKTNPEVAEENRIEIVLQKSKEVSLLRYERQVYNAESGRGPGGWYSLLVKTPALFNNEQFAVFRAVHGWRDQISRADDDSTNFVMPNHVIFSLAKLIPMDMIALLGVARPISHSVKSRAGELLDLIKTAKARGKEGPSMIDVLRPDSVGATAKASLPTIAAVNSKPASEPPVTMVDEAELRSQSSSFWGGAFGSSIWDDSTLTKKNEEIRLAVPLPQLASEIFANSNGFATSLAPTENSPALALPTQPSNQEPKEDDSFVLKHGTKRTSDAIEDVDEVGDEYDISLNELDDGQFRDKPMTKAQRKAERKREKRAKKEAKVAEQIKSSISEPAEPEDDEDEEPFDYSKAESVLHSKRKGEEHPTAGRGKKQKPFDPYAKSADAPKGMRRAQTERAGKSHTFKS
ncbi:hypothetical protein G7Y89_g9139 [Cudoniella acicularis]|uniref:HRDC domain-containing protein n=1 Tax=Cudoniella acicularis TaxID=354080 RepID=A0A8H4RF84_9HELO|nr:hypothetical protein G7Y89_g9139 [Cudoniella acicularis]